MTAIVERLRGANPDDATVQTALATGETLLKAKRYSEAADIFSSVLARRPNDSVALYGAALALFNLRRAAEAEPLAKAAADHLLARSVEREKLASHANSAFVQPMPSCFRRLSRQSEVTTRRR